MNEEQSPHDMILAVFSLIIYARLVAAHVTNSEPGVFSFS